MIQTMTNYQMGQYIETMSACHETGKLAYAIAKNTRKMQDEAKEYLDLRAKLFQQYGKPVGDGKTYSIIGENAKKYNEEMGDIPQIKSDVDIYQVDEETFCSGHLTSTQMTNLLWMVKGNEPEKVEGEVV